jgi:hypothetical protein
MYVVILIKSIKCVFLAVYVGTDKKCLFVAVWVNAELF